MATYTLRGEQRRQVARSRLFNIDNGAGTTVDDVLLRHSRPVRLLAARVVYATETAGTVAAATVALGVAVGGATVAAATAYTDGATVGSATALTLLVTELAANTPLCARHTGIASAAAGEAYVEVEYEVLP